MRLPRLRSTVRGLMAACAIVACLLGGPILLKRRTAEFSRRSAAHAEIEQRCRMLDYRLAMFPPPAEQVGERGERRDRQWFRVMADYHKSLARKYADAASSPWRPVAEDPPPDAGEPPFPPRSRRGLFPGVDDELLRMGQD